MCDFYEAVNLHINKVWKVMCTNFIIKRRLLTQQKLLK